MNRTSLNIANTLPEFQRGAVYGFVRSLNEKTDPSEIIGGLADFACATWGWSGSHVSLRSALDGTFEAPSLRESSGGARLENEHPLVVLLRQYGCVTSQEDLRDAGESEAAALFQSHGWHVCVPLQVHGEIQALIFLGGTPRAPLAVIDLEMLDALAAATVTALERVNHRREMQLLEDAVRRADRLTALGTLAAGVAHEIRNQMVAIQTFVQLVPNRLDDAEFLTSFLALASGEVQRVTDLVGELLIFSRTAERHNATEDTNDLVERTLTILKPEAKKLQLSLRCSLAAEVPSFFGNRDKIRQVVTNLILNALQATPVGGTVEVTTRALRRDDQRRVQIEIRDTGPGIPTLHLGEIFKPFFTTKTEGTGLGLAIARDIVRQHGGDISVESTVGVGTTFTIELPASC